MRIGIDIDGVLTDEHSFIIDFASKYLNICYDHIYNEKLNNKNTIRCYSWYDIYVKIKRIEEKNEKI